MCGSGRILGLGVYTGTGTCDTNLYLVTEVQSLIFGKLVELIMHITLQFSVL
jgi:hypothetical protein